MYAFSTGAHAHCDDSYQKVPTSSSSASSVPGESYCCTRYAIPGVCLLSFSFQLATADVTSIFDMALFEHGDGGRRLAGSMSTGTITTATTSTNTTPTTTTTTTY